MKVTSLSHSDQIVSTLAKLPVSAYGTQSTKEVALASQQDEQNHWLEYVLLPTHNRQGCWLYHEDG